jgi:phage gp29-like protein
VRNIASDAAAIIPASMQLEFVEASKAAANAAVFQGLVEFFERQTSKLVLGQTATTDAIAGGHAVGQEHRQVQEDIERADARQLMVTLKRDLVVPLVSLNMGPRDAYPTIRIGRPAQDDLTLQLSALKELVPLGLKVSMSEVRDKFGFADPDDKDELLGAAAAPSSATVPPAVSPAQAEKPALAAQGTGEADAVDGMVDELLADWKPLAAPLVTAILSAAEDATSAEDFVSRLVAVAAADHGAGLRDALARGQFMARVAARAGATGA